MITFTILAIIIGILAAIGVAILCIGGAMFIAIFADIIVCIAIIVLIMKAISHRRKKRK